ncbi:G5 domain-containing protein [Aerococcus sp. Group 1]|uniref:G5 domain-containing protein n=2 Tax=Aerococcus urinae (strain CCUG 59500 / ACS-120-V-Col10a) TaxID=2976812 RepID=UPI00227B0490|nr:G5 domain-containing protein [Aerococcus sp. Group 1]MCY3030317.1 G5 domain-containing protein [Aerococcus sp. Group 1]
MEKNYRYAIRKTTLGVGSVAIAAFLAGQGQEVQAAETTPTTAETGISQPAALEASPVTPGSTDTGSALPLNEALNTAAPTAVPIARDGVARTENGTIRTTTNDSLAADEHEVKHYRDSDLANNGVSSIITAEDVGTTREGVTASVLNPSPTSTDKKKFGIQVEIDRANSDRTYTNVYVTDNKRGAQVKRGNGEFVKPGQDPDFANVNYPKTAAEAEKINAEVSPGRQITINITTGEEFLKDLNAVDNKNTTFAWKSEYTRDNPNTKMFTGKDFATGFSVNPYPNENKNLSIISVVGETNVAKVPVQGQYLKTGARIENLLPEDYTRITSEVYHPDGTVVDPKEARAILVTPDNQAELTAQVGAVNPGDIVFKMPEGALQDPNSIFNNNKFRGIQNLRARFFARPRTADEFKNIVNEINTNQGYTDKYYVETGAGTQVINHNGQAVTIDKQGIARYDHYNKVGEITVNLDDTRYYDQTFNRIQDPTKDTDYSNALRPGKSITLKINSPSGVGSDPSKSYDDMKNAQAEGRTNGKLVDQFKKAAEAKGWKVETTPGNPSEFTVTAPADAQPGDTMYLPIEYTYTNGSKDTHAFYFVVQDSDNNVPAYHAEIGYQGDTLKQLPEIPDDPNKLKPDSFELVPGTYTDDRGNVWSDVSVNPTTGEVTAVVPEDADIVGGENVYIPVKANYIDPVTKEVRSETVKAQFIARPTNVAQGGHAVVEEIPFDTHVVYDDTLDVGVIKKTDGELGSKRTVYDWNFDNRRRVNRDGRMVEQPVISKVQESIIKPKKDAEIRIGVRPKTETVVIPKGLEVEIDNTMAPGTSTVVDEGHDGAVTVKTTRNPQTGEISLTQEVTTAAAPKKIKLGAKTTGTVVDTDEIPFNYTVEFDPNFYTNYPDATENYKVVTPGHAGSNKKTWTIENSKVVGEPVVETVAPVNAVIKVGQKDYQGSFETVDKDPIPYETEYIVDKTLEPGAEVVENPGELGEQTTTTTHTIQNGQVTASTPGQATRTKEPVKRVVRIGAKTNGEHQVTEPIPFQVEVKKDPSLKKGEYKVETPGKAGSQTKTLTIENSQVTATSEPTINEQATNAVVLVGDQDFTGEVSHDVTEKVPFPVKVIEDPSLDKGTYHVDQEGVPGTKTTTYTQAIKNGAADGALTSAVTAETPAKEHIIRVGTKPLAGSATVTTTNQKPFDVDIEYDNTKSAGTVEIVPNTGIPGEETKTTPVTAADGTVTAGATTTTETKAPVNKKIIVGTQGYSGEFSYDYITYMPFETEVEVDPNLAPNEVVEVQKGQPGKVSNKVTQKVVNGVLQDQHVWTPVQVTDVVNRKLKVGAKTEGVHTYTEELPFTYTVEYDPAIEAGKYEIVTPGKVGSRTTEWPITNSVVGQGKVTQETPATNALIKVGNKDFEGTFTTVDKNPIPFETEYKVDPSLAPGTEVVDQEGVLGEEETPSTHKIVNGQVTASTPGETKQTKAPVKKIVRIGAKTDGTYTHKEELPFEVEVRKVKDLKKGESRVAQQGQPGEQTTTVRIENSQVVGTPTTTLTKSAVKHIIEIGDQDFTGEVSHNVTETLPFKVDIQEDPNLPLFEIQEVQKGENGSVTTKYSQAIKNGSADGQLKTEEIARTEPKTHIIKVGTKAPENTENRVKEVPAEIEYVYDNTKDKGSVEKGAYTPGKVETKIVNKFNPQTGKIETTTEEVVTPAKQVIVVGTKDFSGEFKHTEQSLAPFKTEYKLDPSLKPGQEVVEQEGKLGLIERDVSQKYTNGTMADKVFGQTREVIAPENRIVRIGAQTTGSHTSTEEIPFDVKVEVDPSLPKGEYQVVTPGQPGTKETTVSIENSQIVGEPVSKVTKEPVSQVIKVGNQDFTGQVNHTERFEVPYKVEVRENPNLKAGETKLVQQGQSGSYDVTYTQAVKNGQADGQLERAISNPVEPKAHIIEVGTQPVAGTETAINKEVPVEIEYVFDDSLEKGQVQTGQLTPGKTETKVVSKVVDGQVVNTEETVVTPAKQIVRVGSKDFTGEYKFSNTCPVPFPVEIRENPDLTVGTTKTVQEGVPGSKTTDYAQAIKNGHAEGAPVSQDGAYTAPKAHVIEVGTKPVAGNTHEVNKDVPVETIFEYDPSFVKGKVETVQVIPGHVTTQIVNKVVDGKVVTEEVPVVSPAKHIVKVGTKDYTGSFTTVDKNPLPFEVDYKLDPTLETGKEVVDQEGVPGEEETPTTHTIVNGQVTASTPGQSKQTKAQSRRLFALELRPTAATPIRKKFLSR